MPFQLLPRDVQLLSEGDQLLYGNRPDNLVPVVVLGPGKLVNSVRIRFLADYDTNRRIGGNSFHVTGAKINAYGCDLWVEEAAIIPRCPPGVRA